MFPKFHARAIKVIQHKFLTDSFHNFPWYVHSNVINKWLENAFYRCNVQTVTQTYTKQMMVRVMEKRQTSGNFRDANIPIHILGVWKLPVFTIWTVCSYTTLRNPCSVSIYSTHTCRNSFLCKIWNNNIRGLVRQLYSVSVEISQC